MVNAKRKGARSERKSRDWLLKNGFDYVIKAGGSLGLWDLIAFDCKGERVCFVQVKSNRFPGRFELGFLQAFARSCPPFWTCSIHVWRDRVKEPEISILAEFRG